jgi:hypothetical protein
MSHLHSLALPVICLANQAGVRQAVSPRRAPGPNGVQVSPHEWGIASPLRGSQ